MNGRLIVVSNRLPLQAKEQDGVLTLCSSSGGLVTALLPVLRESGGCWIGWAGGPSEESEALPREIGTGFSLRAVALNAAERKQYYEGFCNQVVWPLFHGLSSRCEFDPAYWEAYGRVNEKFAAAVEKAWRGEDVVWVHDYHLMLVAACLRDRGVRCPLSYFHHIPFPCADTLEKLPWRERLLRSLLEFDVVGFQTASDRRNFIACVRRFLRGARVRAASGGRIALEYGDRSSLLLKCPISIDYQDFSGAAAAPCAEAGAARLRRDLGQRRIVLGVDRLDYTKGILERLRAFGTLLASHPDLRGRVSLLQVVIPSREEVGEYRQLRLEIERRVSQINGRYATPGWTPVQYLYRSLERQDLIAYYRGADVALITPLKDGMNLVAKEFCACRVDEGGVLVLSEFAGAAAELDCGALVVNPYDSEGVAAALASALRMSCWEQRARMQAMRERVRTHDVFRWADFCRTASLPKTRAGLGTPSFASEFRYPTGTAAGMD